MRVPPKLVEINKEVEQGKTPSETVRSFLYWFLAERRGWRVVRQIRAALDSLGLKTVPDFEYAYIGQSVRFVRAEPVQSLDQTAPSDRSTQVESSDPLVDSSGFSTGNEGPVVSHPSDPTYRIGKLPAANRKPVSVKPDTPIQEAISIMLINDFSQLPVMTTEREVKGLFSWKSLATQSFLGEEGKKVADCMDPQFELSTEASIFSAVRIIADAECVLVRDSTRLIVGLVTTFDLALQFGQLGEPFLLLGEIENHVRNLMDGKFTSQQLTEARDPSDSNRTVEDVADLTFGEYVRFLEKPEQWTRLRGNVDRPVFTRSLAEIGVIRNDVMHFDPDGISNDDIDKLRSFAQFLGRLQGAPKASR